MRLVGLLGEIVLGAPELEVAKNAESQPMSEIPSLYLCVGFKFNA